MRTALISITLLLAGCPRSTPATPTELPSREDAEARQENGEASPTGALPGTRGEAPVVSDVPDAHAPMLELLLAHHGEDVPGPDALAQNGAPASLQWLAVNADQMIVRERSLLALADFSDAPSQKVCTDLMGSGSHAKVRAASIRCLAGSDLMADSTLRNKVLAAVRDGDVRVGLASVSVLGKVPAARSGLQAALDDDTISDTVRDAVTEALASM